MTGAGKQTKLTSVAMGRSSSPTCPAKASATHALSGLHRRAAGACDFDSRLLTNAAVVPLVLAPLVAVGREGENRKFAAHLVGVRDLFPIAAARGCLDRKPIIGAGVCVVERLRAARQVGSALRGEARGRRAHAIRRFIAAAGCGGLRVRLSTRMSISPSSSSPALLHVAKAYSAGSSAHWSSPAA